MLLQASDNRTRPTRGGGVLYGESSPSFAHAPPPSLSERCALCPCPRESYLLPDTLTPRGVEAWAAPSGQTARGITDRVSPPHQQSTTTPSHFLAQRAAASCHHTGRCGWKASLPVRQQHGGRTTHNGHVLLENQQQPRTDHETEALPAPGHAAAEGEKRPKACAGHQHRPRSPPDSRASQVPRPPARSCYLMSLIYRHMGKNAGPRRPELPWSGELRVLRTQGSRPRHPATFRRRAAGQVGAKAAHLPQQHQPGTGTQTSLLSCHPASWGPAGRCRCGSLQELAASSGSSLGR